jgi:hypothetical protein
VDSGAEARVTAGRLPAGFCDADGGAPLSGWPRGALGVLAFPAVRGADVGVAVRLEVLFFADVGPPVAGLRVAADLAGLRRRALAEVVEDGRAVPADRVPREVDRLVEPPPVARPRAGALRRGVLRLAMTRPFPEEP